MEGKTIILVKNNVRAYVSDVTKIAQEGIDLHQTYPLPSLVLATSIAAFGPLGIMKKQGKVSSLIKSDGSLETILVETNSEGKMRALVGNPHVVTEFDQNRFNELPLQLGVGTNGILKIVNEINGQTFGGQVKLAKGDIATDLVYYFDQSEQIHTAVQLSVVLKTPKKLAKAYSVIFQLLPGYQESDIQMIEKLVSKNSLANFASIESYIQSLNFEILATKRLH